MSGTWKELLCMLICIFLITTIIPFQVIAKNDQTEHSKAFRLEFIGIKHDSVLIELTSKQADDFDKKIDQLHQKMLLTNSQTELRNILNELTHIFEEFGFLKHSDELNHFINNLYSTHVERISHNCVNKTLFRPTSNTENTLCFVISHFTRCIPFRSLTLLYLDYFLKFFSFGDIPDNIIDIVYRIQSHRVFNLLYLALIIEGDNGKSQNYWLTTIGLEGFKSSNNFNEVILNEFTGIKLVSISSDGSIFDPHPGYLFGFCIHSR